MSGNTYVRFSIPRTTSTIVIGVWYVTRSLHTAVSENATRQDYGTAGQIADWQPTGRFGLTLGEHIYCWHPRGEKGPRAGRLPRWARGEGSGEHDRHTLGG